MAPKRRMTTKGAPRALENGKCTRDSAPPVTETAIVPASQGAMTPTPQQQRQHQQEQSGSSGRGSGPARGDDGAIVPMRRGGGKGLKLVQKSHELEMEQNKVDGSNLQRKSKVKEQKLYHVASNEHVETKLMTEDKRRKTAKDGTVTITSTTTIKKVSYM
uniref:Uncharacterized protein n=1 Tax=Pyrodinium bahamense TaxID=73915 RepID=A0A7S0ADJ8_9DINO|mmetsp:Transcript_31810/g.87570  ORF Transcript_31810/g.87570 Transcript_31810/m.87570 type:complete len:160 (+) Transcript_31810:93-572(+)